MAIAFHDDVANDVFIIVDSEHSSRLFSLVANVIVMAISESDIQPSETIVVASVTPTLDCFHRLTFDMPYEVSTAVTSNASSVASVPSSWLLLVLKEIHTWAPTHLAQIREQHRQNLTTTDHVRKRRYRSKTLE